MNSFTASNGWWGKSKAACSIWEICITGEADDVSIPTVKSGMERIPDLVRGYKIDDIWNMDELRLIFDLLPDQGLIEKVKSKKGCKKAKLCLTNAFLANADEQKVGDLVIIWKSKKPHCFKKSWS